MRDISLHLMDIIQNSISARAGKINISVRTIPDTNMLVITVSDNGTGMDKELLEKVTDPFTTTRKTRKVGLGISLLKAAAERCGGNLSVSSQKGIGTTVTVSFKTDNIDIPPLGDITGTVVNVLTANPEIEMVVVLDNGVNESITFDTNELKNHLGEVPINEYEVLEWIKDFLDDRIKFTFGGVLL